VPRECLIKARRFVTPRWLQLRSCWRGWCTLALAALLMAPATAQALPQDPAAVAGAGIRRLIEAPRFKAATWGIEVVSLDTGRVLFEHNAGKYLLPASNTKLFTVAMALQELGPDLRIRTSLYGTAGPAADGALPGDLVLFGRGDPTLGRPWNGGPYRPDPLEALADQLQAQGVRTIQGNLVGDDSYFAEPPYGPGWEWEDLRFAYGAEPTALAFHHNVADLWVYPAAAAAQPCFLFVQPGHGLLALRNDTRTSAAPAEPGIRVDRLPGESVLRVSGSLAPGSGPVRLTVTIRDSALWAARLLERALARRGIQVQGLVRSAHYRDRASLDPSRQVELGHIDSPPMLEILRELLKTSNDLYAQLTLLQVGARRRGGAGTARQGLMAMAAWMARAGLRPDDTALEEGAGLSRKNLIKPEGIVRLLAHMDRQPEAAAFRSLLPVAGVDGTLRRRMLDGPAQGNLRAKTGTLRNTHALSGYVTSAGGERLAFALMLNNDHPGPGEEAPRAALDAIAELLARLPASAPAPESLSR